MAGSLGHTATEVGCSERTLRRYIGDGLLRGRELHRRRYELPEREERYLHAHWPLLHSLRAALRTERDVRLAVLFGSTATGEDTESSDVDLLVSHRREGGQVLASVRRRLEDALGRRVHLVLLDAAKRSPALLADVLEEGRVIVDRDRSWPALVAEGERILADAERQDAHALALAHAAVDAAHRRTER
ncbi:MAG: nucleotidyltransferase family protein [Thermoleophilaceae bacterium]